MCAPILRLSLRKEGFPIKAKEAPSLMREHRPCYQVLPGLRDNSFYRGWTYFLQIRLNEIPGGQCKRLQASTLMLFKEKELRSTEQKMYLCCPTI